MEFLSDNDIHLHFLVGLPINIEGIGDFHAPTLGEIIAMTEHDYMKSLGFILINKDDINSEDLREFTNFQVVMTLMKSDVNFRECFCKGLNLHLKEEILYEDDLLFIGNVSEQTIYTDDLHEYICKLIRAANHIPQPEIEEEVEYASELGRKMAERQKKLRADLSKYKKPKSNLHSIISAVGWKSTKDFDFISNLNIYQLHDGHSRLRVIDNYSFITSGIYAGTMDTSSIKMEDIDWANIIHINKK